MVAKESIRDAALKVFGSEGLGADLEAVAQEASTTTQDVTEQFGTRDGLQQACTDYVFEVIDATHGSLNPHDSMFEHLAKAGEYESVVRYLAMCLSTGGDVARTLINQMIRDAEASLAEQVKHGIIVDSADPKARARYLTLCQAGALIMEFALAEPGTTSTEIWQGHVETTTLPALELYSHGLLMDGGAMLEDYKKSHLGAGSGASA